MALVRRQPGDIEPPVGRRDGVDPEQGQFPDGQHLDPQPLPTPLPSKDPNHHEAQNTERPRENPELNPQLRPGGMAVPSQPRVPTPAPTGSTEPGPMGPEPFQPMPGVSPGLLAAPKRRLFGGSGGLTGGGLGVPMGSTTGAESDPITSLLRLLQQGG